MIAFVMTEIFNFLRKKIKKEKENELWKFPKLNFRKLKKVILDMLKADVEYLKWITYTSEFRKLYIYMYSGFETMVQFNGDILISQLQMIFLSKKL